MSQNQTTKFLGLTNDEWREFFSVDMSERSTKFYLYMIGIVLTPFNLAGALLGYVRGYHKFMKPYNLKPNLDNLLPAVKGSMVAGVFFLWAINGFIFFLLWLFSGGDARMGAGEIGLLTFNGVVTLIAMYLFERWRNNEYIRSMEFEKFGTARFARPEELQSYVGPNGFYIGGYHTFSEKGHLLTVAGTRGGKGTNLIVPNLLGVGGYEGSFCVIDPKGEVAAITARYQRESGKQVVILNPWDLLEEHIGKADTYNPLDLLSDKSSMHLIDDVEVIAEMIIPIEKEDKNRFFTDNARSIVSGMILHLVTTDMPVERSLSTIWIWARLSGDEWLGLLADMAINVDPINGEAVRNASNAILKLMGAGDHTFGSILSTVLQSTDFLKSPALQQGMKTGFNPATLSDGNTVVYIIIPADKMKSHYRWLRLVVTTCMRAVVRKPNKRVCFLLDEFAALGYLPEIETALSTYAGFNLTVWPILQSLIQLQGLYGNGWETFVGNTAVRQFFSVNDNFTAKYVSEAIGQTTHVTYTKRNGEVGANARPLVSQDEVRRGSGDNMFVFIGAKPPTIFPKQPYYQMGELIDKDGERRFDDNPYIY